MLGMQGSLNLLTSSITTSLQQSALPASPQDNSLSSRERALNILQAQDNDLLREVKLFVWSMIACNPGFTEVYALTVDKDEWQDYVMLEYKVKTGNVALLNTTL